MERRVLPFAAAAVETSDGTAESNRRSGALAHARGAERRGERASGPFSVWDAGEEKTTMFHKCH